MRATAAILLLALIACARAGSAQTGIFRDVRIGDGSQVLSLGAPISAEARPLLAAAGKDTWRVRRGMYGGADSISVYTRADGTVRCIAFAYGPGESFASAFAHYEHDLGAPETVDGTPRTSRQIAMWSDARTAFVLDRNGTRVSSMLCEPEFYQGGGKPSATVGPVRQVPARGRHP
jgi:hypothetical protein